MILITTAGKVGSAAAQALAERDVPVRALARDPNKAARLAQAGVEIVQGDLEVRESVDRAMEGVSAVILVSPPVVAQELTAIQSAKAAGVEHVVKITSKASADSPIRRRRDQTEIEEALIASGLGYTLLRNNAYMQNFLMMAPLIARTDGFRTATGDGRIGHVEARDVGAVAAAIAASPAAHREATYWPTGPESLSGREVAAILSQVLGREIEFTPISSEEQEQAMLAVGLPEAVAEDNARADLLHALEIRVGQLDVGRRDVLRQTRLAPGAGDRDDIVALREQPGERELGSRDVLGLGELGELLYRGLVAGEVLALPAVVPAAHVVCGVIARRLDLSGQEPRPSGE